MQCLMGWPNQVLHHGLVIRYVVVRPPQHSNASRVGSNLGPVRNRQPMRVRECHSQVLTQLFPRATCDGQYEARNDTHDVGTFSTNKLAQPVLALPCARACHAIHCARQHSNDDVHNKHVQAHSFRGFVRVWETGLGGISIEVVSGAKMVSGYFVPLGR